MLEEVEFDLHEVLHSTVGLLELGASSKGLKLTLELSDDLPTTLRGDPARLRQVLFNLIGNAIKFTLQGEVKVMAGLDRVDGEGALIRFSIQDTGIGVAPKDLPKLFKPFTQADSSTTRQFGGTGLGLSISQEIVELMGGELRVESRLGEGSTFTFTVPLP